MKKAITHLRQSDPVLDQLIAKVGPFRQEYSEPTFPALARSIVYQQLNGRAAATIFGRFEAACGAAGITPRSVLKLHPLKMRTCGLSAQKTEYIRDLARHTRDGKVVFEDLPDLSDDDVIAQLTQVKGIGVWTVHMFLIFALRRPDILPVGDYGIRAAMRKLYQLPELPNPARMEEIARPWRPYASIASWYLWRSHDALTP
jgi:DNA-3-methyladenine glycosylase II